MNERNTEKHKNETLSVCLCVGYTPSQHKPVLLNESIKQASMNETLSASAKHRRAGQRHGLPKAGPSGKWAKCLSKPRGWGKASRQKPKQAKGVGWGHKESTKQTGQSRRVEEAEGSAEGVTTTKPGVS